MLLLLSGLTLATLECTRELRSEENRTVIGSGGGGAVLVIIVLLPPIVTDRPAQKWWLQKEEGGPPLHPRRLLNFYNPISWCVHRSGGAPGSLRFCYHSVCYLVCPAPAWCPR